jgi:elongation factor P
MVQTKLKNLRTGNQIEQRFNADDKVERAVLDQTEMEYLYHDGDHYHFMNTESFEQITLSEDILGDYAKYLQPNCHVKVDLYEEKPVAIELPQTMVFKVTEADPSVKRATASAQFKNATLENGIVVRVPPFIEVGDSVKVDTETGEYLERA